MFGYKKINQQKVYNLKTKIIYILPFIQFDKGCNYYDIGHKKINENNKSAKLSNLQNEADYIEFNKVMAGKPVIKKETILADLTFQSNKRSVIANIKKKGNNNSFSLFAANNNCFLPNQLISPLVVPNKILFLLTNIFGANIPLLLEIFQNIKDKKDFTKLPNILQRNYITDKSESLCQFYKKFRIFKQMDHKNSKKLSKSILISYNEFYAKHIFQSYIHMV